ncbi:nuclear transport factor 2 family protein [Virgisporangium aurantiacum]|nr:nuclear transport factor 2 family protein [Virgisporangium aurantiacum]
MAIRSDHEHLRTAEDAMSRWIVGAATGDWSGLLAVLDPAVTFHVPVAGFEGMQHGVDAAARFFARLADTIRADLRVLSTLTDRARNGFEVAVTGTLHGEPFTQRLFLVFETRDGVVREFGEYLAWPMSR